MFRNPEGGLSRLSVGLAFTLVVIGVAAWAMWRPASGDLDAVAKPTGQHGVDSPRSSTSPTTLSTTDASTKSVRNDSDLASSDLANSDLAKNDLASSGKTRLRATVVLVAEDQPQLIPVAANLVAALNRDPSNTFLIVTREPLPEPDRLFLKQLDPARTIIVGLPRVQADITPDAVGGLDTVDGEPSPTGAGSAGAGDVEGTELVSGDTYFEISAAVAKKGWRKREHVVIASQTEPDAVILGATLASHLKVPFLIVDAAMSGTKLTAGLKKLKAAHVTACVSDATRQPKWARTLKLETTLLDRAGAQSAIVQAVGAEHVKNIVLTRTPNMETLDAVAAWSGPYFAQPYRSALLLVDHGNGFEAEKRLFEFILEQNLKPRSLTILGDLTTIGGISTTISVPDPSLEGDFTLDVELGTRPAAGQALAFAVGRFPFMTNAENVLLFTRGLARQRLVGHRLPRMLMVANPNPESGGLPLAETVSRATANEFKNHGVKVAEFYGMPTSNPDVRAGAKDANLILYEGHLGDQKLFEDSGFLLQGDPDSFDPSMESNSEPFDGDHRLRIQNDVNAIPIRGPPLDNEFQNNFVDPDADSDAGAIAARDETRRRLIEQFNDANRTRLAPEQDGSTDAIEFQQANPAFFVPNEFADQPLDPNDPEGLANRQLPPLELNGMPIVILQSCYSLTDWVTRRVSDSGGVAVIGSVTKIHSASGSTFIKAVSDNVLYHHLTIGEAVRDARNYFFCLQDLKTARGHKEQYKSMRVALSFRLWGDPELDVFPRKLAGPKRRAVEVQWAGADGIFVQTPAKRLSTSRTGKYILAQHPGTQAAGMVNRKDINEPARILPIYYARLPLPESYDTASITKLARAKDKTSRAVWRVDDFGRYLHVIYFPQKDRSHAAYELQFHR